MKPNALWLPIAACLALLAGRPRSAVAGHEASDSVSTTETVVFAQGVDPLAASPVQQEQAQARFARGKDHYEAGEYPAAIDEFTASFGIVASPNARLYRARCLLRLGKTVEAYAEYGRTMVQALELGKQEVRYQRTAEAATQERKELEGQLAFVRATVHRPQARTRLFVNGEEIRRTAWGEPIPVVAGTVELELATPDLPSQTETLELAPGSSQELVLDVGERPEQVATAGPPRVESPPDEAPPARAESGSLMPYVYVSAGVGVVGVAAFAVLGTMSKRDFERLESSCTDGNCPPSQADVIERGRREQIGANVSLAIGAVGLATAATLWLIDGTEERDPSVGLGLMPTGAFVWGRM
jgi:hypothetical protein